MVSERCDRTDFFINSFANVIFRVLTHIGPSLYIVMLLRLHRAVKLIVVIENVDVSESSSFEINLAKKVLLAFKYICQQFLPLNE